MNEKRKARVLLADDETHIRTMMKVLIKTIDAEVVAEAENGLEAVELYKKHKPDITLLDINMPVKTGDEALEEIMDADRDAIVVMLTSLADADSVEKCIDLGAASFIRKDTPVDRMRELIENALREAV